MQFFLRLAKFGGMDRCKRRWRWSTRMWTGGRARCGGQRARLQRHSLSTSSRPRRRPSLPPVASGLPSAQPHARTHTLTSLPALPPHIHMPIHMPTCTLSYFKESRLRSCRGFRHAPRAWAISITVPRWMGMQAGCCRPEPGAGDMLAVLICDHKCIVGVQAH